MSDLVLETSRAMIVSLIFVYIWLVGKKENIHRQKGWLYILFGFAFILFGMLIDITDNFPNLNKYIIIGDTEYQAFLEKVVGYLLGFILLAIGFWKWMPIVVSIRKSEKELKRSHSILESELKERAGELIMMKNERLLREIEERKRAEKTLRENEEKLNAMLQSIGDHMSMMDKDLNIIWANETAKKIFGNDIIGKKCFEAYHQRKEPCEPYPCHSLRAFQDGKIHEHNIQAVDKDGKIKLFHSTANVALRNKEGKPTAVIEIARDITKRKQAQEALRESEKKYKTLVHNIPAMVYRGKPDWSAEIINNCEVICGYTDQELNSKKGKWLGIIHPDDKERILKEGSELTKKQKDLVQTYRIISKSGGIRWVEDRKTSLFSEKGEFIGIDGIVFDITQRVQMEEQKEKLQNQLQQAQKMEAIGTLAGGIAHDFNNILFSIMGYTEMTLAVVPEDSMARRNLGEILKAAFRARDLIQQILTFSRQSKHELKPLKVQPVIKESLKLLRSSIPTAIEFRQNIDMECEAVMSDPTQIHQIMMNLCTNAYHAMEDTGGKLEVNLTEVDIEPEDMIDKMDVKPGSKYIRLTVNDTGHGIDQTAMERIFDPYYTTKEQGKGTGLGLSVVHRIVKNHGGHIRVYSEPGKGTTFNVYLPLIETWLDEAPKTASEKFIPKGRERILLVDDEQQLVQMEQQMLEHLGYHVTARTSSVEALEAFRYQPDKFDLVITDMTMPNITGDILAKEIMQIRPDIPIILCTGFSERMSEEAARTLGIKEYMMKPVAMRDLSHAVSKVLAEN